MPGSTDMEQLESDGPALYRIVVGGRLDGGWSGRLADLTITPVRGLEPNFRTVLFGALRDQAELVGVLNTLYGLHLSILNVEALGEVVDHEHPTAGQTRRT